jgi:hypothetical protein
LKIKKRSSKAGSTPRRTRTVGLGKVFNYLREKNWTLGRLDIIELQRLTGKIERTIKNYLEEIEGQTGRIIEGKWRKYRRKKK